VYTRRCGSSTKSTLLRRTTLQTTTYEIKKKKKYIFLADPSKARGCSTNTSVTHYLSERLHLCENIFMPPSRTQGWIWSGCVVGKDGRLGGAWGWWGASGVGFSIQTCTCLSTFRWKQGRSRLVSCLFLQHSSVTGKIKAVCETY
jgi:hypothetical protein